MRTSSFTRLLVVGVSSMAWAIASCSQPAPRPADPDAIVVGSFNFGESELVGELYAQVLEDADLVVEHVPRIGTRELVEPALERGLVDVVPEYAGSLLEFLSDREEGSHDIEHVIRRLSGELGPRGLIALAPAPAENRNALALSPTRAAVGYDAVSDLTGVAAAWRIGGPPECPQRPLCLPGLESVYGLRFEEFVPLDASGPLTFEALRTGAVDVAVVFTTEGRLVEDQVVLLRDDLHLQPADNVLPVVRRDVIDRVGPVLAERLDAVSAELTTAGLRILNLRITEGASIGVVARQWLDEHGLIDDAG